MVLPLQASPDSDQLGQVLGKEGFDAAHGRLDVGILHAGAAKLLLHFPSPLRAVHKAC